MIARSCSATAPMATRITVAPPMPRRMAAALPRGQSRDGHADDDRIVAGQRDVDHDHLGERDQVGVSSNPVMAKSLAFRACQ